MSSFAKKLRWVPTALLLALCFACTKQERIELTLIIENALGPAGVDLEKLHPIQKVSRFVVTVTGDDMEEPVVINLNADTSGTNLDEIPEGAERIFLVEALNAEDVVVRRKMITGITIDKDQAETIVVSLNTVPLFTNVRDGNRIIVNRLKLLGVGEPGGSLEIMDGEEGSTGVLMDVSVGESVITPSLSVGDFNFQPPELALGMHTLTLRDLDTNEQSQVTIRITPPGSIPGTGIVSFGYIDQTHITSGGIPMSSFDADLAHFPDVLLRSTQ